MSVIEREIVDVPCATKPIRTHVVRPKGTGMRWPAIIAWSDIFQCTESHLRLVRRLAGHGFVVVSPELYSRCEPAGTVLDFERDRQRALDDSARVQPGWVDEERSAILTWMRARSDIDPQRVGVCGWCFGGHLAFRAALEPVVGAAACFYPTGLHNGTLGAAQGTADTLERAGSIRADMLLVWGRDDPHIPPAGRSRIHHALDASSVRYETRLFQAEHAFMRDEGPRYDPEATDQAFNAMVGLFRTRFGTSGTHAGSK